MGGGNRRRQPAAVRGVGLSPRGRGKHNGVHRLTSSLRSIPAWAGETGVIPFELVKREVYPRVGGGNDVNAGVVGSRLGLSPRGRGKLLIADTSGYWLGSIPAWAGETWKPPPPASGRSVYPRVGGGNLPLTASMPFVAGLSPRGRGKPASNCLNALRSGSIPAWAGETGSRRCVGVSAEVYPRVGGGNLSSLFIRPFSRGLSPRGRGKRRLG